MKLPFWRRQPSAPDRVAAIRDAMKTGATRPDLVSTFALAALAARAVLGLEMHDEQLRGALALADGRLAEMQTGEGKTLAAVPAACWLARQHGHVHVLTVNDYLARRDAAWMGGLYQRLGLRAAAVTQDMPPAERRAAYAADVTYVTANECGFDLLRDGLCLRPDEPVHQPFAAAILDEADSLLIDEARIPLVIAGALPGAAPGLAERADAVVRPWQRWHHFNVDEHGRNLSLTDFGIHCVEAGFGIVNPFAAGQEDILAAVMDALHAHVFLRRDVDYLVRGGVIESIDEFKGRIAENRRWPAGLHTAVEVKEGVARKEQGAILASLTLENLVRQYSHLSGMTGTAATQAPEFRELYGLEVEVIPPHRPLIRRDAQDRVFRTRAAKEQAIVEEILAVHATGRPVLVGTASVEESERLAARLTGLPHQVLNARHDAHEAALIARAGERNAVTISTNMAGRGTDIRLGEGVAALGGLHVIGTNRHEARRIDDQLRGRAGRQGDPGSSQFFVSLEDPLCLRYGSADPAAAQSIAEGQNLAIRQFLRRYEGVIEAQRRAWQRQRHDVLHGDLPEGERAATLFVMDERWSAYLAAVTELRHGVHWVSWGGREPLHEYLRTVDELHAHLEAPMDDEIASRAVEPRERGATWTYQTTDQPFGTLTERVMKGVIRKWQKGELWG